MNKQDELRRAVLPLIGFLNKYYDSHTYAVVTEGRVDIVRSEMRLFLPVREE